MEGLRGGGGFERLPLLLRFFYISAVFFAFRMRFYVAWIGAEAACLSAAFGGLPRAANGKAGRGAEDGWEEEEEEEG